MAATDKLRIIETAVVTPNDLSLPPRSLPFTFFDVEWLRERPQPLVQRVFFYRLTQQHHVAVQRLISDLKHSLSKALTFFYPLAGHVRRTPGARSNRYELFYQPGDGVAFTAAEYDLHDVDDFLASSDHPVPVSMLAPLVPLLPKGRAVLAVQATVLRRGGLALGVTLHHSACDGASYTQFLHAWAAACAGATDDMPPPPVIDRSLISDRNNLYDIYCAGISLPSDGAEIELAGTTTSSYLDDQLLATFTLSQELIQSIKDALAAEAARRNAPTPLRCSSLLAAYSFIWSCYCRAKHPMDAAGDQARATTYFLFAVDHRKRLNPPVPDQYMGNCLSPAIAAACQDELGAAAGTGTAAGLFAAFTAITVALEQALSDGSHERWDRCMGRVREAAKAGLLSVAGSPRFHVYDVNFGFGRPAKVYMVSAARTGGISVAEAGDGRGGVEFGIPLPAAGMERFSRCFADANRDVGTVHEQD
ncbi:phenolic glucoside malonyltransferase 2-like [Lolium perenne]|uniref:phenolic glucoside malonyltransferase 2-like n=1 Tax=Lolium perenne TaxID=4522 RepID=UPI0021EAB8C9|nr:phenolic glucoside malonyltransferase 2-like [Lolium perenne]